MYDVIVVGYGPTGMLVALQSAFSTASIIERKQETMKEIELTEVEEMREFLRQMRRASYVL